MFLAAILFQWFNEICVSFFWPNENSFFFKLCSGFFFLFSIKLSLLSSKQTKLNGKMSNKRGKKMKKSTLFFAIETSWSFQFLSKWLIHNVFWIWFYSTKYCTKPCLPTLINIHLTLMFCFISCLKIYSNIVFFNMIPLFKWIAMN